MNLHGYPFSPTEEESGMGQILERGSKHNPLKQDAFAI